MKALLRSMFRNFRGSLHSLAGRAWFRVGNVPRARYHFERVLALRGDDFRAYICLGRLAYCSGDYAAWHREYEHARRTCPERFARVWHPFDLIEPRAAGVLFEEAGERATWRASHLAPSTISHAGSPAGTRMMSSAGIRDDFCTEAERCAFRLLRPITAEEIDAVNLDDLARRLIQDS